MNRPKISVIIPVYNAASFLSRALDRVLRQSCPAHEVIVINDGSTDDTQKVLDDYKGRILTKTIPNSGCGGARNVGARMATGDVLAFVDADDLWFRKKLRVVSEYLERFPEIGFFGSNYLVHSDYHGGIVRHYDYLPNLKQINFDAPLKRLPFKLLLANNLVGTPSAVIVRKKLFEQLGGFDADCRFIEDLEFFLRAAKQTDFVLIHQSLFYKHGHEQSMTNDQIKTYEGHRRVLAKSIASHQEYIRENHLEKDAALGMSGIFFILGRLYFNAGKRRVAFAMYWEGLQTAWYPSNILSYLWNVSKKTVRILSGNLLKKA